MKTTTDKAKNIQVKCERGNYVVEYTLGRRKMVYSRWFSSKLAVTKFLKFLTGDSQREIADFLSL
jgi:hypothetical protein